MGRPFDIRWLIGAGLALLVVAVLWDSTATPPVKPARGDDGFQNLEVALAHVHDEHERAAVASDPGQVLAAPAPPAGCGARYALPIDPADCAHPPEADADGEISTGVSGGCGIRVTPTGAEWAWTLSDGDFRGPVRCVAGACRSPALDVRDGAEAPAGLSHAWVACSGGVP